MRIIILERDKKMTDMKINPGIEYYGFNHKEALKRFNGTKFLGEWDIRGYYEPVAIYYAENPDESRSLRILSFTPKSNTATALFDLLLL